MNTSTPDQQHALHRARLMWGGTLLLVLPLPFVAGAVTGMAWLEESPGGTAAQWNTMALIIGAVLLVGGLYSRNQTYKANWKGDATSPEGYVRGNLQLFGSIALAGLIAFAIGIWQGLPTASYQAAIVLLGLLVFNFPNGKPMQPQPPRLGGDGEL